MDFYKFLTDFLLIFFRLFTTLIVINCNLNNHVVESVDIICELHENENFQVEKEACYVSEVISINKGDSLNFIVNERNLSDITSVLFTPAAQKQTNITFIPTQIFEIFPQLHKLDLQASINSLNRADFARATSLQQLTINNDLEIIPERVFFFARNLTSLVLAKNHITQIEDYAFSGLSYLETLALAKNGLTTLRRHTFSGLPKLSVLNLRDNSIQTIEDGTFDLPALTELNLSKNNLTTLSDNIFICAPLLKIINIDTNQLERVGTSLYGLQNAVRIIIYQNKITDLDLLAFSKLPELTALWLRDSGFKFDNKSVESYQTSQSKLTYLDISYNNLSNNENFRKLVSFPHLKTLNIDGNQFTEINIGNQTFRQFFPELETIHLSNNKWNCKWLEKALEDLKRDNIRPVSSGCPD